MDTNNMLPAVEKLPVVIIDIYGTQKAHLCNSQEEYRATLNKLLETNDPNELIVCEFSQPVRVFHS